jgi:hypothetical protein
MDIFSKSNDSNKFNIIRTKLLIISNNENNYYLKNSKILHNSEKITDIVKKYENFEVKLNNPTIISNMNFSVGNNKLINKNTFSNPFNENLLNFNIINNNTSSFYCNYGEFFENKKITFSKQKIERNSKILIEKIELIKQQKINSNNNNISYDKVLKNSKSNKYFSNSIIFSKSVIFRNFGNIDELKKSNKIQKSFEYLQKMARSMKIIKIQNTENNNFLEKYDELLDILEYKNLNQEKTLIEDVLKKSTEKQICQIKEIKEKKKIAIDIFPNLSQNNSKFNSPEKVYGQKYKEKEILNSDIYKSDKKNSKKNNSIKKPPTGKKVIIVESDRIYSTKKEEDLNGKNKNKKENLLNMPFSFSELSTEKYKDKENYRSCSFNKQINEIGNNFNAPIPLQILDKDKNEEKYDIKDKDKDNTYLENLKEIIIEFEENEINDFDIPIYYNYIRKNKNNNNIIINNNSNNNNNNNNNKNNNNYPFTNNNIRKKFEEKKNILEKKKLIDEYKNLKSEIKIEKQINIDTNSDNQYDNFTIELKEFEMSNINSTSLLSNNDFISNNYLKSNNSNSPNAFSSVSFYELNSDIN